MNVVRLPPVVRVHPDFESAIRRQLLDMAVKATIQIVHLRLPEPIAAGTPREFRQWIAPLWLEGGMSQWDLATIRAQFARLSNSLLTNSGLS